MNRHRRRPPAGVSDSTQRTLSEVHRHQLNMLIVKGVIAAAIVFLAIPLPVMLGEGKQTVITLTYQALIEGKAADKLQKALVFLTSLLLFVQRRHYTKRLKSLGARTEKLEKRLDPHRSSSNPKEDG